MCKLTSFFYFLLISITISYGNSQFPSFKNDLLLEDIGGIGNKYFFRGIEKLSWNDSKAHCESKGFKIAHLTQSIDIDFVYNNTPSNIDLWTDSMLVPSLKNFRSLRSNNPVNQTLTFSYFESALSALTFSTRANRNKRLHQTALHTVGWNSPLCVFELPTVNGIESAETLFVEESENHNISNSKIINLEKNQNYNKKGYIKDFSPRLGFIGEFNDKLYFYGENKTTWTDAPNYCDEFSMNLTEILNEEEIGFIYANGPELLMWTSFYLTPSYSDFIWLSLNQTAVGYPYPIMTTTHTSSFTSLTLDGRVGPTSGHLIQTLQYELHNPLCHLDLSIVNYE